MGGATSEAGDAIRGGGSVKTPGGWDGGWGREWGRGGGDRQKQQANPGGFAWVGGPGGGHPAGIPGRAGHYLAVAASFFQVRRGALVTRPFLRALAATRM